MKRNFNPWRMFLILLFFQHYVGIGQSLVNPYRRYYDPTSSTSLTLNISSPAYRVNRNNSDITVYNTTKQEYYLGSGQFTGEYMIILRPGSTVIDDYWHFKLKNHAITYEMELVSYPFCMPDCWETGCAGQNDRKMKMPNHSYNSSTNQWGALNRMRTNGYLYPNDNNPSSVSTLISGNVLVGDWPEALVSAGFLEITGPVERNILPHSVIKHTLYVHCNLSKFSNIIDTLTWTYDLTRGRMRWYPFNDQNSNVGGGANYDVMYIPQLTIKPDHPYFGPAGFVEHLYNETDNQAWVDGGTINYMDFSTPPSNCSTGQYFPSQHSDIFMLYGSTNFPINGMPPDFSLIHAPLRNGHGEVLAGYSMVDPNTIKVPFSTFLGMKQEYFINKDFNLSILNPAEMVIYNPSEVSIDPDAGDLQGNQPPIEVIFPSGYTFKTILGRYPSVQEVADANNDPQNGGPYTDLRQVPVPVNAADLPPSPGTTSNDYPQVMWDDPLSVDPNDFYHDERFGYYYIEDKATLTIETCVRIFDARFAVRSGGTMAFNDYPSILGHEDKDNFIGRYKIRGEGGAILRNFAPVQYVQNGNITQPTSLNYIALGSIIAGNDVDPDPDQPDGDYVVQANADVTFTAGNNIHLQPGFSVQGGNFHGHIDENIAVPTPCAPISSQGNPNRISPSTANQHSEDYFRIHVFPNPNNGSFTVSSSHPLRSVTITDLTGRRILQKDNLSALSLQITLSEKVSGILLVQVTGQDGEMRMEKLVVR